MPHAQILILETPCLVVNLQNGNAREGVFVADCIALAPVRSAKYEIYLTRRSRLPCLGEVLPGDRGSILFMY